MEARQRSSTAITPDAARRLAMLIAAKIDIYDEHEWSSKMIAQVAAIITAEAGTLLGVEEVGRELREFWPGCSYQIVRHTAAGFHKPAEQWFEIDIISTDYKLHGEHFKGDTLELAMQSARDWKHVEDAKGDKQ